VSTPPAPRVGGDPRSLPAHSSHRRARAPLASARCTSSSRRSGALTRRQHAMKTKKYMNELRKLQVELAHLQAWVKEKKLRVVIVLEGRDGAGKGGTIKAMTERVSARV